MSQYRSDLHSQSTDQPALYAQINNTQKADLPTAKMLTMLHQQLAQLHQLQDHYQHLLESVEEGLVVLQEQQAVFVNQNFARLLKYDSVLDVLSVKPFLSLFAESHAAALQMCLTEAVLCADYSQRMICCAVLREGKPIWLRIWVQCIHWRGQRSVLLSCKTLPETQLPETELPEAQLPQTQRLLSDGSESDQTTRAADARQVDQSGLRTELNSVLAAHASPQIWRWFDTEIWQHCQRLHHQAAQCLDTLCFSLHADPHHIPAVRSIARTYQRIFELLNHLFADQYSSQSSACAEPVSAAAYCSQLLSQLSLLSSDRLRMDWKVQHGLWNTVLPRQTLEALILGLTARVKEVLKADGGELIIHLSNRSTQQLPKRLIPVLGQCHQVKLTFSIQTRTAHLKAVQAAFPIPVSVLPTAAERRSAISATEAKRAHLARPHYEAVIQSPQYFLNPHLAPEASLHQLQQWLSAQRGYLSVRHDPLHGVSVTMYLPSADEDPEGPTPSAA